MTEQATVITIDGSRVTLACREEEKCKSCTSGFCSVSKGRQIIARNSIGLTLNHGDTVDVHIPTGKTILAGFMVLIFPLIMFFAAYILLETFAPGTTEALKVLAGFGGLVLGFGISWIRGKLNAGREMPEILALSSLERIPEDGDEECPDCGSY